MLAAWLRPEERRGPLQNFIRTLELTNLLLTLTHASLFIGCDTSFFTVFNVGLAYP